MDARTNLLNQFLDRLSRIERVLELLCRVELGRQRRLSKSIDLTPEQRIAAEQFTRELELELDR